jgi:hypothetical protein
MACCLLIADPSSAADLASGVIVGDGTTAAKDKF